MSRREGPRPEAAETPADPAVSAPAPPVSVRASVRALNRAQQEEIEATPTERRFMVNGAEWRATIAGESAYGTGAQSVAYLVAIRFQGPDDENPSREALLPRGQFEVMYDEEFAELLERATRI